MLNSEDGIGIQRNDMVEYLGGKPPLSEHSVVSSLLSDDGLTPYDIPMARTPAGKMNRFPSKHGKYCPDYVESVKSRGGEISRKEIPKQVSTVRSSIFNLVNTILGAGVIAFAYGIRSTGLLAGVILVLIYVVISAFTLHVLFKAWMNARVNYNTHLGSYQDFIEFYLGKSWMVSFEILLFFYILGALVVYLTVVGDSFSPMAAELFGENNFYGNRKFVMFTMCSLAAYPLSCFRKVHMLRYASCISVCSVVLLIFMIPISFVANWIRKGSAINDIETQNLFLNVSLDKGIYPQFFMTLPLLSFAFDCHILSPSLARELKQPKMSKFNTIVVASISIVATMYLSLGICGYLRFGDSIKPDILLSFKGNTGSTLDFVIALLGRLSLGVVGSTSYPLMVFPLRDSVLSIYGHFKSCFTTSENRKVKKKSAQLGTFSFICVTTIAFLFTVTCAIFIPNIGIIMGFVGAIGGTSTMYLFPFIILWRTVPPKKGNKMKKASSYLQLDDIELENAEKEEKDGTFKRLYYIIVYRCCSLFGVCFSFTAMITGFLATVFSLIVDIENSTK